MSDGKGCKCNAYCEEECACGADWTPQELIDARNRITELESLLHTKETELSQSLSDLEELQDKFILYKKIQQEFDEKDTERLERSKKELFSWKQAHEMQKDITLAFMDDCNKLEKYKNALSFIVSHWRVAIGTGDSVWHLMHEVHHKQMSLDQVVGECEDLSTQEEK